MEHQRKNPILKTCYCGLWLLWGLVFLVQPTYSQGPFTYRVEVTLKEKVGAQTRLEAMNHAARKALLQHAKAQGLSVSIQDLSIFSDEDLDQMTLETDIIHEKLSQKAYRGVFNVHLEAQKAQTLLQKLPPQGKPSLRPAPPLATEKTPDPAAGDIKDPALPDLIVPFLVDQDSLLLWAKNNDWMQYWQENQDNHTSWMLPLGDLRDIQTLSPKDLMTGSLSALDDMLKKYRLERVHIMKLERPKQSQPTLTIFSYGQKKWHRVYGPMSLPAFEDEELLYQKAFNHAQDFLNPSKREGEKTLANQSYGLSISFEKKDSFWQTRKKLHEIADFTEVSEVHYAHDHALFLVRTSLKPHEVLELLQEKGYRLLSLEGREKCQGHPIIAKALFSEKAVKDTSS